MIATMLNQLSPEDAARVQAIVQEFRAREVEVQGEIAQRS